MHIETSVGGVAVRWVGATGLGPPGRRLRGISIDFRLLTSGVYTISFPPLSPRRRYKVLYTLRVHHPLLPTTTSHRPSPKSSTHRAVPAAVVVQVVRGRKGKAYV